jgi:hypothetical protein
MARGGRFRCTWFEHGRRCSLLPAEEHRDQAGKLWAFLCMAHEHIVQKVTKTGTIDEIRAALRKAQGRKR